MLGLYESFPANVHNISHFTASVSEKNLQHALIDMLRKTNEQAFDLENVAAPSIHQCKVVFEFGIAEANSFNYLNAEEAKKITTKLDKTPLKIIDFFSAIRYYRIHNGREIPLRFDYYLLRFTFNRKWLEIQVFHEKGPMHVSPEELLDFITHRVNESFARKVLKPFEG